MALGFLVRLDVTDDVIRRSLIFFAGSRLRDERI